ncbi:hypothetical protein [Roseivirga pacifica]|uniref:hypothetical protein n=1 Tax=Roseivirga pacifica TaxID=1267423 RepID=UPI00227A1019|nr:hypothetical protein [Roseivirga pacifica]
MISKEELESFFEFNEFNRDLPIGYKLLDNQPMEELTKTMTRYVSAENYQSDSQPCLDFYKPISRVIDYDQDTSI